MAQRLRLPPATSRAPAAHPDPAPAQGGSRIGRVLGLLGRLILYGHDLADKLSQCAGTPAFAHLAIPFGTTNLVAILRGITRGLTLASALHERLSVQRSAAPAQPRTAASGQCRAH